MQDTWNPAARMGSITPALEGAPASGSHENRGKAVIPPTPAAKNGEEGAPSRL